jgi:hypothetical protein
MPPRRSGRIRGHDPGSRPGRRRGVCKGSADRVRERLRRRPQRASAWLKRNARSHAKGAASFAKTSLRTGGCPFRAQSDRSRRRAARAVVGSDCRACRAAEDEGSQMFGRFGRDLCRQHVGRGALPLAVGLLALGIGVTSAHAKPLEHFSGNNQGSFVRDDFCGDMEVRIDFDYDFTLVARESGPNRPPALPSASMASRHSRTSPPASR